MNIYFAKDEMINRARHSLTFAIKHLTCAGDRDNKEATPYHNPAQAYSQYIYDFYKLGELVVQRSNKPKPFRSSYFPKIFMNTVMKEDDYCIDLDGIVSEFLEMAALYTSQSTGKPASFRFLPIYGERAFDAIYGIDPKKSDLNRWFGEDIFGKWGYTPEEVREMWIVEKVEYYV